MRFPAGAEKQCRVQAQANADWFRADWCVFLDTSGGWNCERYDPKRPSHWENAGVYKPGDGQVRG